MKTNCTAGKRIYISSENKDYRLLRLELNRPFGVLFATKAFTAMIPPVRKTFIPGCKQFKKNKTGPPGAAGFDSALLIFNEVA